MKKQPFCISLEEGIIVNIFNNEIIELQDYAIDSGDPIWHIMGTDAWLELQETEGKIALVGKNYEKTYFSCFINDKIFEKLKDIEECGMIVISSSEEFTPEDLTSKLNSDSNPEDITKWIEDKIKYDNIPMVGLMFCYYTKEMRKKYHGDDYRD